MNNSELLIQLAEKLQNIRKYYGEFTEHPDGLDWDVNRSYLAYYITRAEDLREHLPEIENAISLAAKIQHHRGKEILRSLIKSRNTTKKILSNKPSSKEVKREAKHHKKYGKEYLFYLSLHKAACITNDFSGIAYELETDGGIEQAYQQATQELSRGDSRENKPVKEPKAENVFKKTGDVWTVTFQGNTKHIPDSVGFSYIKLLLSHKGEAFTTTEFLSLYNDKPVTLASGDNQLDDKAKEEYKKSLADIEYRLEVAKNNNDFGTQEKLGDEKARITNELSRAAGFGRHKKKLNPEFNKYRLSIGNAIVNAFKKIGKRIPELKKHLRDAIRNPYSGTSLSYRPSKPTNWAL